MSLVIKSGHVVDGTGNPWYRADVLIDRGKIVKVGRVDKSEGERVIDADGMIVAPGFIDPHTHSDIPLLADPRAESSVRQGVTTEAIGNCGGSAGPVKPPEEEAERTNLLTTHESFGVKTDWRTLGEYLNRLARQGVAHNVASFVGHRTVRLYVMGYADRGPTASELEEMKKLAAQAMEEGAIGLSSGLEYIPGKSGAPTSELVELCKVVRKYGGIYTSHVRDMNDGILDATRELIQIGEEAGVPANHSHLGSFFPGEGLIGEAIELMDQARARGVEVTADATMVGMVSSLPADQQRPAGMTGLNTILPPWAFEGGKDELIKRLKDPETRIKFKLYRRPKFRQFLLDKWDNIFITESQANKGFVNKTLGEIAKIRGKEGWDVALDLLLEELEATGTARVSMAGKTTTIENVRQSVLWPWAAISSDGTSISPVGPTSVRNAQPSAFGNFPCFFRWFVNSEKAIRLEDAVRKCTSLPAQILQLKDRGLLKEGMWADIVVFDDKRIRDMATFEKRKEFPEGIEYVVVNGEMVVERGRQHDALPGKVLRGKGGKVC